jgi:hypothetical protein
MKRLCIISLILLLITLTSCQTNEQTEAEIYLANHSEQDIVDYFSEAALFYCDFNDTKDIPEKNLYTFAMFHERDSWFDETEQTFYIPIADIYEILNSYIDDYNLPIEWFENKFEGEYDTTNQIITAQAIGMGTGCTSYAFINAEIIDTQNIKIILLEYCEDYALDAYSSNIYITAQIVNGNAKFTSYKRNKSNTP